MRAYCHIHKETFSTEMVTPITCERGRHVLGKAPHDTTGKEVWQYCCECRSFWLTFPDDVCRAECPVCDREAAVRYLCGHCLTLTIESNNPSSVREFFISPHEAPRPCCPGCARLPNRPLVTHDCKSYRAQFFSARSTCPFCNTRIAEPIEDKSTTADHLAQDSPWSQPSQSRQRRLLPKLAIVITTAIAAVLIPSLLWLATSKSEEKDTNAGDSVRVFPTAPPGMVYVKGGTFTMGDDAGDEYESPAHSVTVKPFFIDVHEVTCAQYAEFVKATGRKPPADWTEGSFPTDADNLPVTGIDWYDAQAYADWIGKRLPTEEEWEFAARGTDRRKFSWGHRWQPGAANAGESSAGRLVSVGLYPDGRSPFGVLDMIGNAREWTASDLQPYPGAEISNPPAGPRKVIRGGSWVRYNPPDWTTTFRGFALPSGGRDYSKIGFRCAKDALETPISKKGK